MKILLFIDTLRGGGAQRQMAEMARLFDKYGHDVTVATTANVPDDYYVPETVKRVRLNNGYSRIRRNFEIFKFFQLNHFDGIITFMVNRMAILCTFFHLFRNYVIIAGERAYSLDPNVIRNLNKNLSFYYKFVDYVVPNSDAQRQQILELNKSYRKNTITISNYTDINYYIPSGISSNGCIKIGIFARYHEGKNGLRFIESLAKVKEICGSNFHIEWYGHQYSSDHKFEVIYLKMKNLIDEYDLSDVITLNDRIKDVRTIMPSLSAVCLPSLYEGFSNSIAEGICCGKPILAGDIADNKTMVKDEYNGYLFNPYDIDNMTETIVKFIQLPYQKKLEMGRSSRMLAEHLFNEQEFVDKYIQLLDKKK